MMKIDKMKIDIAMANKGYSAKELSKNSGISQITIARLKRGVQEARPETIGKIAKALNVPVENLIDMKGRE